LTKLVEISDVKILALEPALGMLFVKSSITPQFAHANLVLLEIHSQDVKPFLLHHQKELKKETPVYLLLVARTVFVPMYKVKPSANANQRLLDLHPTAE